MTPLAGRVARWGQKVALGLALVMALPLSLAAARSPARSEEVKGEPRRALIRLGFEVGQVVAFLAPVLGLLVFWFFVFKLAVTLHLDRRAGHGAPEGRGGRPAAARDRGDREQAGA
jgi:hypothetical protein